MARVTGPLMSISARGTIGKAITFSVWKGIAYVREHFVPANPKTATQVNVRTAMRLAVADFQGLSQPQLDAYDGGATGQGISGYNLYMRRSMNAYILQLTSANTPVSVAVVGNYPADVFTWL